MKRTFVIVIVFSLLTAPASAAPLRVATNAASGLAINLPLVGRVLGSGAVLYRTSVDIANNGSVSTVVDFYFDGRDNGGAAIAITGSVTNNGLVAQGAGTLRATTNVHFDDFVQSLVNAGMLTAEARDRGVTGSLFLVFNAFTRSGEGSAAARFYSEQNGGTIGVTIGGREMTTEEPSAVVGLVHDTRGGSGPQLYPNMFLNNTGLTRSGTPTGSVLVELRAVSAGTGIQIGRTMTVDIPSGHTVTIGEVASQLQIPAREPALVFARVISGDATIHGIISTNDVKTRDGSIVYMSRAD
jgi:hypothetical protein